MEPLFQSKSNKYGIFWVCVCSLRYPACNAHGPYCHLWPVRPHCIYISTLPHKRHIFRKKNVTEHKMCELIFSANLSQTFLILRRNDPDMIKKVYWSSCKCLLFLSDYNTTWNFSTYFRKKNTQIPNFMKIRPVGTELFDTGRQRSRHDKASSSFSQCCGCA